MNRTIDPLIIKERDKFNDNDKFSGNDSSFLSLYWKDEYLCLYCNGRLLTTGEIEVLERIKVLNRERGYQFF